MMNNTNTIGIHFIDLEEKELSLFNRVISFNTNHGLKAEILEDVSHSDLIIVTDKSYASVEHLGQSKTIVVLSNNEESSLGDFQICRPLMITKVMNLLGSAIEKTKTKSTETQAIDSSNISNEVIKNTPTKTSIENKKTHHALIIDDSAAIRKQLELELRDAGISSDYAEAGEDALEKIKNKDNDFDLIFLDIIMPGIDGYATCKEIRSNPNYKKTPIIMLSGKTAPLDEVQGVIAGATTYLTKPVKSDKLQTVLNRVTKWIDNFAPTKKTETA